MNLFLTALKTGAWVLLDERLTGLAVLGLALSTVGVAVATRRRA